MRTLFFRISSSNYLIAIHFLLFHTLFSMSETQSFMARMLKITEYSFIAVLLWRLDLLGGQEIVISSVSFRHAN